MPDITVAGLIPASAAQIMQGRLDGLLDWDEYYDSGDAIVYHPDGRVKLVYDAEPSRLLSLRSRLLNGALVLPDGAWESLDGEVFTKADTNRYTSKWQAREDVRVNPFWRFLARGDQVLLDKTVDEMFRKVQKRGWDLDFTAMSVYIGTVQKVPVLRLWRLDGVNEHDGGSADANGGESLDGYCSYGWLVGVALN